MPLTSQAEAQLRAKTDRRFIDELYALSNSMHDLTDPLLSWVGDKIGEIADRAVFMDARSPEDYDDKMACFELIRH